MISQPVPSTLEPGPAWEVARLFPDQGDWGDGDYLALNQLTNRFVELTDGRVEVLEMPSRSHQFIAQYLLEKLNENTRVSGAGKTVLAPYPVRVRSGKFRQPDVVFMLTEHLDRLGEDFADGSDLVMEVVSRDRDRDFVEKRGDYAEAEIPEYWIVDPRDRRVIVLRLEGGAYVVHGEHGAGERASSALLPGFGVDVADVFAAAGL
jgi:Uma2 family endonuclease